MDKKTINKELTNKQKKLIKTIVTQLDEYKVRFGKFKEQKYSDMDIDYLTFIKDNFDKISYIKSYAELKLNPSRETLDGYFKAKEEAKQYKALPTAANRSLDSVAIATAADHPKPTEATE